MGRKQPVALGAAPADAPWGVRFLGDGSAFIQEVPMRDMTASEWADLDDAQRAQCLALGLYQIATEAPAAAPEG